MDGEILVVASSLGNVTLYKHNARHQVSFILLRELWTITIGQLTDMFFFSAGNQTVNITHAIVLSLGWSQNFEADSRTWMVTIVLLLDTSKLSDTFTHFCVTMIYYIEAVGVLNTLVFVVDDCWTEAVEKSASLRKYGMPVHCSSYQRWWHRRYRWWRW